MHDAREVRHSYWISIENVGKIRAYGATSYEAIDSIYYKYSDRQSDRKKYVAHLII